MKRDLTVPQKWIVSVVCVVVIFAVAGRLLAGMGVLGFTDSWAGYYTLQVNPAPSAPANLQMGDYAFAMDRLTLRADHTIRLGPLQGTWGSSGSEVSLNPTNSPPRDQFYASTTMGDTLAAMLKPITFTKGTDG